jgi:hypothetical protein
MTRTTRDLILAFMLASFVLIVCLQAGGGAPTPAPPGIPDPGQFVGWALPFTKLLTDLSAVLVIGFLVAVVFLVPTTGDEVEGLSVQAVRIASRWAIVWAVASVALFFLTASDIFGEPLSKLSWAYTFGGRGLASVSLGRAILLQALAAAAVAIATRWTLGVRPLAAILGLSLGAMAPIALTGHAASSGSHDLATTSLLLHLVGVTLWVGGLAALGWIAIRGSKRLEAAVTRFSTLGSLPPAQASPGWPSPSCSSWPPRSAWPWPCRVRRPRSAPTRSTPPSRICSADLFRLLPAC